MVVYGDCTNSDTRAILAVLMLSGQHFQYINLDVLSNGHETNAKFANISPGGDYPVMHDGNFVLICTTAKNMDYLCATRPNIKKYLYPTDCEKQIKMHLNWYENKMRPKTRRLINILARQIQVETNPRSNLHND